MRLVTPASSTWATTTPLSGLPFIHGDFDRDGDLDLDDFGEWATHMTGPCALPSPAGQPPTPTPAATSPTSMTTGTSTWAILPNFSDCIRRHCDTRTRRGLVGGFNGPGVGLHRAPMAVGMRGAWSDGTARRQTGPGFLYPSPRSGPFVGPVVTIAPQIALTSPKTSPAVKFFCDKT